MRFQEGCYTNVSRALENNLTKTYNARNHTYSENFKLKRCTCVQSMFQLEILISCTISAIPKFWENILESSGNVKQPLDILMNTAHMKSVLLPFTNKITTILSVYLFLRLRLHECVQYWCITGVHDARDNFFILLVALLHGVGMWVGIEHCHT